MSRKSDRNPVTQDELVALFIAHCQASPDEANAQRNKLECKFKTAVKEARTMGVLTLDILNDLKTLTAANPRTGNKETVCPPSLTRHLDNTIAHYHAIAAKEDRIQTSRKLLEAKA
jgi:hypothetical protein